MEKAFEIRPRIVELTEKKLVGIHLTMSLAENKTGLLWSRFMPRRHEVLNKNNNDLISLQIYSAQHFRDFNPKNEFIKWACVEVKSFENIPAGMETLMLQAGTYAIFDYKGLSTDYGIFNYIFSTWLPHSNYDLDHRPHFEVLGEKYKNNDPDSEEEIWIPIKPKG